MLETLITNVTKAHNTKKSAQIWSRQCPPYQHPMYLLKNKLVSFSLQCATAIVECVHNIKEYALGHILNRYVFICEQ